MHAAARLGLVVHPIHRGARLSESVPIMPCDGPAPITTIVGNGYFGDVDEARMMMARRLADAAGVDLLAVHWSRDEGEIRFRGADVLPDLSPPDVADAVLAYLTSGGRC